MPVDKATLKRFSEFHEIEYDDVDPQSLNELSLRNTSALILFNRIHARSKKVHQSNDVSEQLRDIASQNTHLAAMIFALTSNLRNRT